MNERTDEAEEELAVEFPVLPPGSSDPEIEEYFRKGRLRVGRDENKLFLVHVVDFVRQRRWGELQPAYQRRLRWPDEKKSRLIESFLMNVPVPPVFLYEKSIGAFEVMDGQQRLSAIIQFFDGTLTLEGLRIWPALNGRTFNKLPPLVRIGLERATLSAITLIPEEDDKNPFGMALRTQVFERLNTGGEKLNAQELRNALYGGLFNKATIDLASLKLFTEAWDIPAHSEHTLSDDTPDSDLRRNRYYKTMEDVEIVLRFFAFRDSSKISGSVRKMLDDTAKSGMRLSRSEVAGRVDDFSRTLEIASKIFGDDLFRRAPAKAGTKGPPSKPLYDAVMVALFSLEGRWNEIESHSAAIRERVLDMTKPQSPEYQKFTGRANTATSIKERIDLLEQVLTETL